MGAKKKKSKAKQSTEAPTGPSQTGASGFERTFYLLEVVPLFIGSFLASRSLLLPELLLFTCIVAPLFLFRILESAREHSKQKGGLGELVGYGGLLILTLLFYGEAESIPLTLLFVLSSGLFIARRILNKKEIEGLVGSICIIPAQMAAFGLLGGASQAIDVLENMAAILAFCLLGFAPGTVLAACEVAKSAALLESLGWSRSKTVVRLGKSDVLRPMGTARLFGFLLLLGPTTLVAFSIAGLLPVILCAGALPVLFLAQLAQVFLERRQSDLQIAQRTLRLALVCGLITYGAAFVALTK